MKKKKKTKLLLHPGKMYFSDGNALKLNKSYAADKNSYEKLKSYIYIPLFYLIRLAAVYGAGYGFAMLMPESFEMDFDRSVVYAALLLSVLIFGFLKYAVKNKWICAAGLGVVYTLLGFKFYKEIVRGFGLTLCQAINNMIRQFDVHVPEWAEELSSSQWSVTVFTAALAVVFVGIMIMESGMGGGSAGALLMFGAVVAAVLITGTGLPAKPVMIFVFSYFVLASSGKLENVADAKNAAILGIKGMAVCGVFFALALAVSALLITDDMHLTKEKAEQIKKDVQYKFENVGEVLQNKRSDVTFFNMSGGISEGRLDKADGLNFNGQLMLTLHTGRVADGSVYLKGFVSDIFKNNRWYPLDAGDFEDLTGDVDEAMELWNMQSNSLKHMGERDTMTVENQNGVRGSFAPYGAVVTEEMTMHGDGWIDGGQSAEYTYYPEIYSYDRNFTAYDGAFSERSSAEYLDYVRQRYMQIPDDLEDNADDFARIQDDFIMDEGNSLSDKVAFIQRKMWSLASYTTTPDKLPSDRAFLPYFLYESHEGYCMHFATAGVILLRLNGIPARYAEGFVCAPGNFQRDGADSFRCDVRDFQAHAWAEVYIDGFGWIPVEMTPGYVNAESISEGIHHQGGATADESTENQTDTDENGNAQTSEETVENPSDETEVYESNHQNNGDADNNSGENNGGDGGSGNDDGGNGNTDKNSGDNNASSDDGGLGKTDGKFKIPEWFWKCLKVAGVIAAAVCLVIGRMIVMNRRYTSIFEGRQKKKALLTMYGGINRWLWLAGAGHLEKSTGLERMTAVEKLGEVSSEMFAVFEMVVWKAAFGKEGVSDEEYESAMTAYSVIVRQIQKKLPAVKNIFAKVILCLPKAGKMQG